MSFGTAKLCVITDVYGTVLFKEYHHASLDEISCLEVVEVDAISIIGCGECYLPSIPSLAFSPRSATSG